MVHNNVVLLLHRLFQLPTLAHGTIPRPATEWDDVPRFDSWTPLDSSGAYVLQASVRVQDGGKPETMTLGLNELLAVKDTLRGIVDLEPGDRLAMDTRVR